MSYNEDEGSIAVLVDGENIASSALSSIIEEVGKYGRITIRRIYGDWTSPHMVRWKKELHENAFQPIQQFQFTKGKNSSDSALIIDAMDILHSKVVDGFCIISSDSDYTRLATRIREHGKFVMGIGEKKTPKSLVNACEVFVYLENILSSQEQKKKNGKNADSNKKALIEMVKKAIDNCGEESEWKNLAIVGSQLRKMDPSFDTRTWGYMKLSHVILDNKKLFEYKMDHNLYPPISYVKIIE